MFSFCVYIINFETKISERHSIRNRLINCIALGYNLNDLFSTTIQTVEMILENDNCWKLHLDLQNDCYFKNNLIIQL